jgi:hypothetical protein
MNCLTSETMKKEAFVCQIDLHVSAGEVRLMFTRARGRAEGQTKKETCL